MRLRISCAFFGTRFQRVLDRADRGDAMNQRANPADALGECPRVAQVASLQDDLDALAIVPDE
jgi:hypothetical protein